MDTKKPLPHCGKMLRTYFDEKRIYKAALARKMEKNYSSLLILEKRSSLQAAVLWNLSHALEHNFFADIARHLPEHYTKSQPELDALNAQIAELQHQNELLTTQLNLLKEVMRKD